VTSEGISWSSNTLSAPQCEQRGTVIGDQGFVM